MRKETYPDLNYTKGLERFMHKEDMYKTFLQQFLYDCSFEEFCSGVAMGDMGMADKALQTLRGTSANLSFEKLYHATGAAAQAISDGYGEAEMQDIIEEVKEAYMSACNAAKAHIGLK